MSISRKVFYDSVRKSPFGGSLSQPAVDNMETILNYWFANHPDSPIAQLAYVLATVRREVGANMAPVRETFAKSDAQARARLAGKAYGKPAGEFGHVYYGRGYVQLTWLKNYRAQQKKLNIPIVENPDLVLKAEFAIKILVEGMLDGDFNGDDNKGLDHYVNESKQDFFQARHTVNVLDHAEEIAGFARAFLKALELAEEVGGPVDVAVISSDEHEAAKVAEEVGAEAVGSDTGNLLADRLRELAILLGGMRAGMSGNASPAASDQRLQDILQKVETMAASLDGLDKSKLKVVVDDLAKVVDGKPPLTQVNGAFGETIGRLLDGRKTAFGILGTLATFLLGGANGVPVLNATNAGTIIGPILQAVGVSSPVLLPITIALTAWGVLGKVDKWVKTNQK